MWKCGKCGNVNDDNQRFCMKCHQRKDTSNLQKKIDERNKLVNDPDQEDLIK